MEVDGQWWIYYSGWTGRTAERDGAIGLAKVRKEGFLSRRGPAGGGVVCTRRIVWPGGRLLVNAKVTGGEMKVRVSDAGRRPIEGFNYGDCRPFAGDDLAHEFVWRDESLDRLKGRTIRLEFFLRNADLFTFRAGARESS